jgi:catechol 2,3-dioxygenase-like lactoylglutathione lyase family enzyme
MNTTSNVYPKIINHIAISVPNLDDAVKWYREVLGFTVVKQAAEFEADDSLKEGLSKTFMVQD